MLPVTDSNLRWHEWLEPGDHILCSHMTAEPQHLLASLAASTLPPGLTLDLGVPFSLAARAIPDSVKLQVMGGMGSARELARTHALEKDRTEYLTLTEHYASGTKQSDIVLLSLARADDGTLHLGASHGPALEAARRARQVIIEINEQAPVVNGASWPADIPVLHQVSCGYPVATLGPVTQPGMAEKQIAAHLAELVPDGACLQVGIGSLPSAVLSVLASHRHLGIHSGMTSDALYGLVQQGAVDNSRKPDSLQQSVTGCVYGSAELYKAVENDPAVILAPPVATHSLKTLQSINNFTAINSALEVDHSGRVNAESVLSRTGSRHYVGGVGGLPACVRGALASSGGLSIIALPSRRNGSTQDSSRIRRSLEAEVTLDETLADIVVTEHGVARLRHASLKSRREQLQAIS